MHVRACLNCAELLRRKVGGVTLEYVLEEARRSYARAMISYGKTVGNLAAQSLSEPMTQLVLDSHHGAGAGVAGRNPLDSVKDLFGVRSTHVNKSRKRGTVVAEVEEKTISGMTVQVLPPFCYNSTQVKIIANELEMMDLRMFVSSMQVFYEEYGRPEHPSYRHESALVEEFHRFFLQPATPESQEAQKPRRRGAPPPRVDRVSAPPHDLTRWCIRLQLDKRAMIEKQMNLTAIILRLRGAFPRLWIVHTPENARQAIVRLYLRTGAIRKADSPDRESVEVLGRDVLNQVIRGVPHVKTATVEERNQYLRQEDGRLQKINCYYISTLGSNLVRVMEHPKVDPRGCQSTSLPEMLEVFGIMVARAKLTYMLKRSIEGCSFRHYALYADEMTFHGVVTAINNFGSAKRGASPLLQISDEHPLQVITKSAVNGAKDDLAGISAPILMGKTPRVGDMYNTYVFNREMVRAEAVSVSRVIEQL
jgi:hypothetical protein